MVESNVHIVAVAVDGVGEWLNGVGVENDFVDGGGFAKEEGVEVFARLAVRNAVRGEDKEVVVEYRVSFVAGRIDSVAKVDGSCPAVSVPKGAPKIIATETYLAHGSEYHHFAIGRKCGMTDVSLPTVDIDAVYFAEGLWGVGVEIGSAVRVASGEVECAIVGIAYDVVGIGDDVGPQGVGLERRKWVL